MANNLIEAFIELLCPRSVKCISCGSEINMDQPYALCAQCIGRFIFVGKSAGALEACHVCGKPLGNYYGIDVCVACNERPRAFDRGIMVVAYNQAAQKVIFDLKYHGKTYIGYHIAQMMIDRLRREMDLSEIECVIPVPIHKSRYRKRGFNQAEILGRYISEALGVPIMEGLERTRNTKTQNKIKKHERFSNVDGAFEIRKNSFGDAMTNFKTVLLVDDIYTTGATADACSEALKTHGVEKIFVVGFASGEN